MDDGSLFWWSRPFKFTIMQSGQYLEFKFVHNPAVLPEYHFKNALTLGFGCVETIGGFIHKRESTIENQNTFYGSHNSSF